MLAKKEKEQYLLKVHNLTHWFGSQDQKLVVLKDVSFQVKEKEFITIIGPSGCGKSTLFNLISGLLKPKQGKIFMGGSKELNDINDQTAYMFQKDLLLDWRDVLGNAILGGEILGESKEKLKQEAMKWMEVFGLKGFEHNYPFTLSGGMRQRVAFLRTLLTEREIMLLDEPFGALDAYTRKIMQKFLLDIWDNLNRTVLFITHDIDEAILLADRVLIMSERPTTIKAVVEVPFSRPRHSYDILLSDEYTKLKGFIIKEIYPTTKEEGGLG